MACRMTMEPCAAAGLPGHLVRGALSGLVRASSSVQAPLARSSGAPLSSSSSLLLPTHKQLFGSRLVPRTPPSSRPQRLSVAPRAVLGPAASSAVDAAVAASSHLAPAAHNALATLADVAADVTTTAASAVQAAEAVTEDGGWFGGLANILEGFLKVLEQGLTTLHVPYAYGFSIILLTFLVKLATYPLTKKQVESTLSMQALAPKLKNIQSKFAGDQERIQMETARLYKTAGVNPLAGCLPTLATLPIWIGLYQALSNVAKEGVLTEGFFWIPSLAGPASLASRDDGSGLAWLFNWVDGAPPLGWLNTGAYLVLPVLLVASQYYSMQILQPPQMSDDPAQKNTQLILKFLPIMIGWFALSVPSGLSLYWFTNNILSTAQTVYLRQMGGASPAMTTDSVAEIIDVGQAKRSTVDTSAVSKDTGDADAARAERFKRLKEMEAERKAARRAAEEAARAAAVEAQQQRQELDQQQGTASTPAAAQVVDTEVVHHEDKVEAEEADLKVPPVAPAKVSAAVPSGSGGPTSRRSKRTRRS